MNFKAPKPVAAAAFILVVIAGALFYFASSVPRVTAPFLEVSASDSHRGGSSAPAINSTGAVAAADEGRAGAPFSSGQVPVLAVDPNLAPAVVAPPKPLAADWQRGYQAYQYPDGLVPDYRGTPVLAYVAAGGKKTILAPNQAGIFPRLFLAQGDRVSVVLQFPEGKAGDAVGVAALDGGSIDRDNPAEVLTLNEAGAAELNFTLSANPGVSRVSVQYGAQTTTLDFWGGPNNVFPQLSGAALKSIVR